MMDPGKANHIMALGKKKKKTPEKGKNLNSGTHL